MIASLRNGLRLCAMLVCMSLFGCATTSSTLQPARQFAQPKAIKWSVSDRMQQYASTAKRYFQPYFRHLRMPYLAGDLAIIILKQEKRMQLYVNYHHAWHFLHSFPVLGLSGHSGPKLKEGDRQVPEGMYQIAAFNPNSRFFLSLKLNYPNDFDWLQADKTGRSNLGSNIFIHGSNRSRGCIAMGDQAMKYLFPLIVSYSRKNSSWGGDVPVIIAPYDFRSHAKRHRYDTNLPWVAALYQQMSTALRYFPLPR